MKKLQDYSFVRSSLIQTVTLPLILMTALTGILFWQIQSLLAINHSVNRLDEVVSKAYETQKLLIDLETGCRGFYLTGSEDFLKPYTDSLKPLGESLIQLQTLVKGNKDQTDRTQEIVRVATDWMAGTKRGIARKRKGENLGPLMVKGKGKKRMDRMRDLISQIIREEEKNRFSRNGEAQRTTNFVFLTIWGAALVLAPTLALFTRHQILKVGGTYEDLLANKERLEEEIRHKAQELEEADRQKDQFLAVLGHELKSPLGAISNALYLLRRHRPDNDDPTRYYNLLERQVGQITRLIGDLQDISRIKRGKLSLQKSRIDLHSVIRQAVEATRAQVEAQGHTLTLELPEQPFWLEGDPERLAQVFTNLIANAAKYTDPGGKIDVSVEDNNHECLIKVRDTGIGIAPESLEAIFALYSQLEHGEGHAQGGMGLGLALVRGLVHEHRGEVQAFSDGPGRGSEFVVRLPVSLA